MNKKLNLINILKNCPQGTKLYSPLFGEVEFINIEYDSDFPIRTKDKYNCFRVFDTDGTFFFTYPKSQIMLLFPSKEQQDWEMFNVTIHK